MSVKIQKDNLAQKVAQNRKEAILKRSETYFRSLIENTVDLIMVIDPVGLIFFQSNHSHKRYLGYEEDELIGKNIMDFLHPQDAEDFLEKIFKVTKNPSQRYDLEYRFRHKTKGWYTLEGVCINLLDDSNISGLLINVRDVSKRKVLEQELIRVSEAERSRLSQELHDTLNQHLVGLQFLTQILGENLKKKNITEEIEQVEKIRSHIDEAVAMTRSIARGLYPMGLSGENFESALTDFVTEVSQRHKIECKLHYDISVRVINDESATQIYHIVREATKNSVLHGKAKTIQVEIYGSKKDLTLTVRDNGIGLPRGKKWIQGIGLRIMAERAKMLNGRFKIERNASGGTTLTCNFPRKRIISKKRKKVLL